MHLWEDKKLVCCLEDGHEGTCRFRVQGKHRVPVKVSGQPLSEQIKADREERASKLASGGSWRSATAVPTVVDGRRFPSIVQAETYKWLRARALRDEQEHGVKTHILHEVSLLLPALGVIDMKPAAWRCDFMVLRQDGLSEWSVEIYESKGNKRAMDSKFPWQLRAYYQTYDWPLYVCQRVDGEIVVKTGQEFLE